MPKTAVSSETVATAEGKATQPGMPVVRSLWSASRCRILTRPAAVAEAEVEEARR